MTEKNPKQKPKKKQKTKVENYVNKALNWANIANYSTYDGVPDFAYFGEGDEVSEDEAISVKRTVTEASVYKALKKNKLFKKYTEKFLKEATLGIVQSIDSNIEYFKDQKRREAQQAKEEEKRRKAEEKANAKKEAQLLKLKEKGRKDKIKRDIFKETLTDSQRKSIKKFYGIDVDKFVIK